MTQNRMPLCVTHAAHYLRKNVNGSENLLDEKMLNIILYDNSCSKSDCKTCITRPENGELAQ